MRVRNIGGTTAENVRLFITSINELGSALIIEDDAVPTHPSQTNDSVYSLAIQPKFGRYFDIAYINRNDNNKMSFYGSEIAARTSKSLDNASSFVIGFAVIADNANLVSYTFQVSHQDGSADLKVAEFRPATSK